MDEIEQVGNLAVMIGDEREIERRPLCLFDVRGPPLVAVDRVD